MHSSASTRMRTACGTPSSRRVSRASNTLHFSKYMAVHNIPPVLDHLVARLAEIQPSDPLKQMYTDLGDLLGLAQRASEPEQRQDQPEASTACRLDLSGKFVDREGRIKPIRLHMAVDRTAFTLARARAWIALVEAEINTAILPRPSTDGIRTSGGGLEEGWGRARAQTADTAGYGRSATRERDQNGDGERRVLIVEEEEDGGDREGGREEKTLEREGGRTGGEQQRGKRDTGTPEPREKRESKAGKGGLLRTLFDELDADGDGSLTSSELEAGLTRLGLQPTAESLALVQASVGLQAGDEMPFEQFKTAAQKLMAGTDAASESWTTLRWLEGLSGEGKTLAAAFAHALQVPPGYQGSQFEFVKSLSANQTELQRRLADPKCQDMVVSVVRHHVDALARQEASTAAEMNAKFSASIEEMFSYGGREVYEGGLNEHIGTPNDLDPVEEIFREHCVYEYACAMAIVTRNYGITTDPTQEFRAVAGRWTPTDRSFLPVDGFEIPPETQNLSSDEHRRRFLGVPELMELESAVQAGLQEPEVVAVRLWTGPMYQVYNGILRNGVKDQFTTTLHALSSAIYKLSRIAKPEMVYRGLGGRAIPQDLLGKGVVEYGAQSFTTDKNVAVGYAKMLSGDPGTIRPTYVFEVLEGEVDKGADVSELSFYPHEKEKLYGPLAMMQPVSDSIDESTLVIRMRVNVNQKAGTLDEVRARRKQLLVGTANTLHRETGSRKDVALIEAAGGGEGASRRADLRAVREGFEQRGDAAWFNDPGNFRLANNALLGAWEGVLNHAELWGEVEDLVADEYVQRMEEELGREGQGKSLELRKERAEDQKRVEALKGMEASREEVGVLVKRRRRDLVPEPETRNPKPETLKP